MQVLAKHHIPSRHHYYHQSSASNPVKTGTFRLVELPEKKSSSSLVAMKLEQFALNLKRFIIVTLFPMDSMIDALVANANQDLYRVSFRLVEFDNNRTTSSFAKRSLYADVLTRRDTVK